MWRFSKEKGTGTPSKGKPSGISKTPSELARNDLKPVADGKRAKLDDEEQGKAPIRVQRRSRTMRPSDDPCEASNESRTSTVNLDTPTDRLHRLVRHWSGLRQDCEDLQAQLKFLHDTYNKVKESKNSKDIMDRTVDAGESFEALESQCDICVRWTQVYLDRTHARIGLVRLTSGTRERKAHSG